MPVPAASLLPVQEGSFEQLHQFAAAGFLFAVIDSTCNATIEAKAQELGPRALPIFQDPDEAQHWPVAPYIFQVDPQTLAWIAANIWMKPWGVFAMSKGSLEDLRRHFRRFLIVELPDGERWFFRYYDPRILKIYLPACNESELRLLFGPSATAVRAFGVGDPDSRSLVIVHTPNSNAGQLNEAEDDHDGLWKIRPEQLTALQHADQK